MSNKITVIHHSADYDGIFCREIARKFLPEAELIGWDFANDSVPLHGYPVDHQFYILDLPVDKVFGFDFKLSPTQPFFEPRKEHVVWIDHHKSSIDSHPTDIPGYRIDGVAACRLAWQWFSAQSDPTFHKYGGALPTKDRFIERLVTEPLAVRLAGEYDIWDKRDPHAEVFQFGLRSRELIPEDWQRLLGFDHEWLVDELLHDGMLLQRYQQSTDKGVMGRSFLVDWEGLKFLALNTARCNSLTFASKDVPETGHDALLGFYYNGKLWTVSLYHAKHRMDLDLSLIAVKHGGGGHKGACGFTSKTFPI